MSEPIRVLHVVVAGELGGAERMLADLAAPGGMRGVAHTVALLPASPRLEPFFLAAGLTVSAHPLRAEGPIGYLQNAFSEARLAWLQGVAYQTRAQLLHVHTIGSQVLGTRAALHLGLPVVRTEHSSRAFDDLTAWPFSRWSLQRATASVAISKHIAQTVCARAPWAAAKLRTIANGVDTDRYAFTPMPPRDPAAPFRFVMSGRLDPRKGIDIALCALALTPEVVLDVVGDGPSRSELETLSAKLRVSSRVRFHGYQSDVRPHLANSHAVLSASRNEGLGLAVLEAMAMGRPAVAVPVGGLPEFVDRRTGVLAHACTPQALSQAMRELAACSSPQERADAARARVVERYSLRAMRDGYAALYHELALSAQMQSTSS